VTSSPLYPQANGLAEKTVQTVKHLLEKAKQSGADPYLAILAYRSTPLDKTGSPAQLLMNRRIRTDLPTSEKLMKPKLMVPEKVQKVLRDNRATQERYYNRGARPRPQVQVHDNVRMRQGTSWVPATVTAVADTPRSYHVRTDNGGEYRRNRRDINITMETTRETDVAVETQVPKPPEAAPQLVAEHNSPQPEPGGRKPVRYTSHGRPVYCPKRFQD